MKTFFERERTKSVLVPDRRDRRGRKEGEERREVSSWTVLNEKDPFNKNYVIIIH